MGASAGSGGGSGNADAAADDEEALHLPPALFLARLADPCF